MANINDATPVRFENGGSITINNGADKVVVHVEAGTLTFQDGLTARDPVTDRNQYTGVIIEGDQRRSKIEFSVKLTAESYDTSEFVKVLRSSFTTGALTKYTLAIALFDYRAGPGKLRTWSNCYIEEDPVYKAAGPGGFDTIAATIYSLDTVATDTDFT